MTYLLGRPIKGVTTNSQVPHRGLCELPYLRSEILSELSKLVLIHVDEPGFCELKQVCCAHVQAFVGELGELAKSLLVVASPQFVLAGLINNRKGNRFVFDLPTISVGRDSDDSLSPSFPVGVWLECLFQLLFEGGLVFPVLLRKHPELLLDRLLQSADVNGFRGPDDCETLRLVLLQQLM